LAAVTRAYISPRSMEVGWYANPRDSGMRQSRMRKFLKRALGLSAIAAAGYAVWRSFQRRAAASGGSGESWEAQPFPYPPQPRITPAPLPWVEPVAGVCPASHPVKAKLASGIFHAPGGASYERTLADRCYASATAASADGLRPAKR
ncbi:MAG: hypothetical protein ACHQDE_09585, partial [Acidimicrobiia bacterium]